MTYTKEERRLYQAAYRKKLKEQREATRLKVQKWRAKQDRKALREYTTLQVAEWRAKQRLLEEKGE